MKNVSEKERAYWNHEVAEQLDIGTSTLRKWCLELEENEYVFTKGEQESRAFLKRDIDVLMHMKNEIRNKKKSLKDGAKIALEKARTGVVLVEREQEQAAPVPVEQAQPMFTLEDMRNIVREELEEQVKARENERDKALMGVMRELQDVKKMIAASQEVSKKKWWEFWKS